MPVLMDTRSTPSGLLAPSGKCRESIAMGLVAMATERDGQQITQIGGIGYPIGEQSSGPLGKDAKGARAVCPWPRTPRWLAKGVQCTRWFDGSCKLASSGIWMPELAGLQLPSNHPVHRTIHWRSERGGRERCEIALSDCKILSIV